MTICFENIGCTKVLIDGSIHVEFNTEEEAMDFIIKFIENHLQVTNP